MEDAILLISNLSLPCLITNMTFLYWILLFQNMKNPLLQNKNLVWVQEEKVQILAAICASLPAVTEKAGLLQTAGLPNLDDTIITWVAASSQEEPGTSNRGQTPGFQDLCGGSAPPHWITTAFLHPLALPANCFIASDLDSASEAEAGSDSKGSSGRELNEVHPPPSDFQDVRCIPPMRVAYRDLVPMTRLFSTQLPISEGDYMHLPNFIQGKDIPPGLYPEHENCKRMEGGTSSKD